MLVSMMLTEANNSSKMLGIGSGESQLLNCSEAGAALSILDTVELQRPVRLLGICLSNLKHQAEQLPLFEEERKKLYATQAMDTINDRFGSMAVTFGSLVKDKDGAGSHVIPPSWRPYGIKNVDVK